MGVGARRTWPTVLLGQVISDIQPGFASGKHNSSGYGIQHFRPMNVSSDGRIDRSVVKYVDPSAGHPELRLRRGDVLFNNTNSPQLVGKTALFEGDDAPAFSNHMTRLRADPALLDPAYLALRLHYAWREGWFEENCNNHVSQASVSRDVLRGFEMKLPPLDLQRAISSFVQTVKSHHESCNEYLQGAVAHIRKFKKAVLSEAISGRITADWRSDALSGSDTDQLPVGWTRVTIEELAEPGASVSYGIVKPGPEIPGGVPYVRQQDIVDGTVLVDQLAHTSEDIAFKHQRTALQEGDILLCVIRNLRVATVPPGIDGANITQGMVRIRPGSRVLGEYLSHYLSAPNTQRKMRDRYVGLAMPRINVRDARELLVALPPLAEQHEIASRVEGLLRLADKLEERIHYAARRAEGITQSILAKAFRGDLITGPRLGELNEPMRSEHD